MKKVTKKSTVRKPISKMSKKTPSKKVVKPKVEVKSNNTEYQKGDLIADLVVFHKKALAGKMSVFPAGTTVMIIKIQDGFRVKKGSSPRTYYAKRSRIDLM